MKEGYVYILECNGFYKIGVSGWPEDRAMGINSSMPFDVNLIVYFYCIDSYGVESHLQNLFLGKHYKGEWFRLSQKDVDGIIKSIPRLSKTKRYEGIKPFRARLRYLYG